MAEKLTPEVEQKLRERFNRDFETAKKFNEPIHQRMDHDYEMYRNRWKGDTDFRVSKFFSYVETVVPFMVNNRVRGYVKAEFPEYVKHAEGMTYILDHTFDVNNWDYMAQRIAKMAEIYRYALAYTGYDPNAYNGTGKLCITEVNPRWCYVDPAVTDLQDSSFFIYVEPMRLTKAIKKHPGKAKEIKESVAKKKGNMQGDSRPWFQSWFRAVKNFMRFNFEQHKAQGDTFPLMPEIDEAEKRAEAVAYIHYWYRDDDDKWRVSFWADDVLLEDRPNPFWHGKLPYAAYVPNEDILSAVGIPIGEHIENLNWEFNVLMNEIIRNVGLANDPPILRNTAYGNIQDKNALVEPRKWNGVIDVNNPDMVPLNAIVDVLAVPQVPPAAFRLKELFDQIEDQLLGTNDTMRGIGDASSGREVQLKQEAAYTRIKTKLDNFEKFVKQLSEMIIVNAMQFIDTTRPFRVKGDYRQYMTAQEGELPFTVEPIRVGMDEAGQPIYDRKEFFLFANPNEWTKLDDGDPTNDDQPAQSDEKSEGKVKEAFRILQFVVEIEAGSSLPMSRAARREDALLLFQAGAIDQQALLEAFEYPNAEEIMRRMGEVARAQQEAQAQAEQSKVQSQAQLKQMELQQKAQIEQAKLMTQAQIKGMEVQAKVAEKMANQPIQPTQASGQYPDIASRLDQIRQIVPELANATDEQILELIARIPIQQQV